MILLIPTLILREKIKTTSIIKKEHLDRFKLKPTLFYYSKHKSER